VGASPAGVPDPEKGCLSSSAESLSSWSSSDGVKRLDSRSSGSSGARASSGGKRGDSGGSSGGPPRRHHSRVHSGIEVGGVAVAGVGAAEALPRRADSLRSAGSRRSEGTSMRRPDSSGSLHQLQSSGSAKYAQPGAVAAGAGSGWGALPSRSLHRGGGSGTWGSSGGEGELEVARSQGSGGSLRHTLSDQSVGAPQVSGSLHRVLSGAGAADPSAPRVYVPATPPKAQRYVQPAPSLTRSPSKSPSGKLPKVNE
jgi:hypothetical protein